MIDHFGINCSDLQKTAAFYDTVLATLGHRRLLDFEVAVGYGTDKPDFWLSTFDGVGPNREVHVAFTAPDADAVRAFFQAAVDQGAEVLHEPRLWPEYHETYFGGFVRDPEGNNLEAVCHRGDSGH
jgi:catechol 2,3-dioxygenase-like lactoylglutathione lyase family enzyme